MVLAMVALFLIWKKYNGTPTDYKKLWGLTIIIWLFCSAHTYIYDALLLLIAAVFLIAPEMPEGEVRNKSDLFRERMLLCTPYLQWLGMVVLPLNYHRSLPTSLILLTLCISIALDKKKSL